MRMRLVALALLFVAACSTEHNGEYRPVLDKRTFTANVTNPWFPLTPGTTLVYEGKKDEETSRNAMSVTNDVLMIDGVPCRVVLDRLYVAGKLEETTRDYYTQDAKGNVWYFGEDTAELDEHGRVKTREGTWRAGRNGAQPGIFMSAHPKVGESHRQEYYKGHAEDRYRVASLSETVTVPKGRFGGALQTTETTRLEPGVVGAKYYARGIGVVEERSLRGPFEQNSLVEIRRPT